MPFSADERAALLALKGVGSTVISRLEQMGIESLQMLGDSNVDDITGAGFGSAGVNLLEEQPAGASGDNCGSDAWQAVEH